MYELDFHIEVSYETPSGHYKEIARIPLDVMLIQLLRAFREAFDGGVRFEIKRED
ncbi:MAG: hypothetical protein J7J52_04710 [Deltaproteobacteria bacterium]|nr:hypothetical protein [Deltaproteobacteria bacterium]